MALILLPLMLFCEAFSKLASNLDQAEEESLFWVVYRYNLALLSLDLLDLNCRFEAWMSHQTTIFSNIQHLLSRKTDWTEYVLLLLTFHINLIMISSAICAKKYQRSPKHDENWDLTHWSKRGSWTPHIHLCSEWFASPGESLPHLSPTLLDFLFFLFVSFPRSFFYLLPSISPLDPECFEPLPCCLWTKIRGSVLAHTHTAAAHSGARDGLLFWLPGSLSVSVYLCLSLFHCWVLQMHEN